MGSTLLIFLEQNFIFVLFALLVLNICKNGDIISIIYIFMFLVYGLLEHPFTPSKFYSVLLVYTMIVISLKFIY